MLRRLTLLTALGCGCLALIWGLFWLQGIFIDERDDALAGIDAQRDALQQYARQELKQTLRDRLADAKPTIRKAAQDPLVPASELYLYEGDVQVLPRIAAARGEDIGSPWVIYRNAVRRPLDVHFEVGSPAEERHQLLLAIAAKLERGDRNEIQASVRTFLGHRSRYVILSSTDIALTLAMVQVVAAHKPHAEFMRRMLREGFGRDRHMEGLQRALLRKRGGFTAHDFEALAKDISELSKAASVLHSDFEARVAETAIAPLLTSSGKPISSDIDTGTLVLKGTWYVEPSRGRVVGVRVSMKAILDEITAAMRARGLLESDDEVVGNVRRDELAIDQVTLEVESERWNSAIADVDGRYQLKAGLLVGVGLLVFGIAGMGVTLYRRRRRFLELKSDFVSAVSHELRTPLASIRLMAETIERRTKDVPGVRDYPTRIIRDIDGLSFLIENILSFDRLQRGRWQPKLQHGLRLSEVIAKVDAERDNWSRGRKVELVCEALDVTLIDADPDLLQLVFTNLARNACQYNERDPVRLHLVASRSSNEWVVLFRDNGVGIPKDERERIFDDFYRAKVLSGRGERGSGLGLSICRKIVEAHRGAISVEEAGSEGTTIELRFPIAAS